jgi:hypothetical protein
MTTDAGSGFDDQAASRDAGTNLDEVEEESRHLSDDESGDAVGDEVAEAVEEPDDEAHERKHSHDSVNDAF